jgi:hypothetical protein
MLDDLPAAEMSDALNAIRRPAISSQAPGGRSENLAAI